LTIAKKGCFVLTPNAYRPFWVAVSAQGVLSVGHGTVVGANMCMTSTLPLKLKQKRTPWVLGFGGSATAPASFKFVSLVAGKDMKKAAVRAQQVKAVQSFMANNARQLADLQAVIAQHAKDKTPAGKKALKAAMLKHRGELAARYASDMAAQQRKLATASQIRLGRVSSAGAAPAPQYAHLQFRLQTRKGNKERSAMHKAFAAKLKQAMKLATPAPATHADLVAAVKQAAAAVPVDKQQIAKAPHAVVKAPHVADVREHKAPHGALD